MTQLDLILLRFLLACAGCVAAGLIVWLVTRASRRSEAVTAQRSVWLLSQLTIAVAFLAVMLPHSERLRIVAPIELDQQVVVNDSGASPDGAAPLAAGDQSASKVSTAPPALATAARLWMLVYLLGLGHAVFVVIRARRALQGLAASGSAIDAHASGLAKRLTVLEVDAPISPMLFGLLKPCLLLPRHLRQFDPLQQRMIVEHELTHLRRGDLAWMGAGITLQALFWFNPFIRLLGAQMLWAQELGCDRDVLQGRSADERRAYAAALVAQLRHQRQASQAALAFGGVSAHSVAARIAQIRTPPQAVHGRRVRLAIFVALASTVAASVLFQPALAWRAGPLAQSAASDSLDCTIVADAATGELLLHEGQCDERVTPASTFNIVVSLMGYDSGILQDERTPALPFKEGYADYIDSWRATTDPTNWIANSVLWYAQQVTARLGDKQFHDYVSRFEYGNGDASGDPGENNGLTMSWLGSSLKITPVEQLAFLRKIVRRELGLKEQAYVMTSRILTRDTLASGWDIRGKTGTANPTLAGGRDDESRHYGWYVGWAQKEGRTLVFARLLLDKRIPGNPGGMRAKKDFLNKFAQAALH